MLEEAKENYKSLRYSTRIGIMIIIGFLPAGYVYYTEVLTISEQLELAQQAKTEETKKYQDAKKKKEEITQVRGEICYCNGRAEESTRKTTQ